MSRILALLTVTLWLCLSVSGQVAPEPMELVPGQPVERDIAGAGRPYYLNCSLI